MRRALRADGLILKAAKTTASGNDGLAWQRTPERGYSAWIYVEPMLPWWHLFTYIVSLICLTAVAFMRSFHGKRALRHADFHFPIHSTILQLLGLTVTALLEWKGSKLPNFG